ncbi:MAG: hypothetical protein QM372_03715 [Bacillota bacterium]|nr:hypothetical protein [Bacillota bacterium]NLJ02903.1 DUF342 domain-containing protein [Bacillota bacterium]
MRNLKKITQAPTWGQAVRMVWQAGVSSFETKVRQDKLEQDKARLEQELLELSRLVHDYETKIHNNVRENKELAQKNKELEWGYRALLRENQWLKEEIFNLKGKPLA